MEPTGGLATRSAAGPRQWLLRAAVLVVIAPLAILLVVWVVRELVQVVLQLEVAWRGSAIDWMQLVTDSARPNPFAGPLYRWSPVAAWVFALLVAPMGLLVFRLLHIAAAFAFRNRLVTTVLLLSYPFWTDLISGQVIIFVVLAGWWAYRGSRAGTIVWFALALLMPRPMVVPLTVWLLWKRPWTRPWFAGLFVAHAALVFGSGLGYDWIARLLSTTSGQIAHPGNLAPSHWIGVAWIPIGLALSAILTWKGRLGLAALAAQPYIFAYYLTIVVLEVACGMPPALARARERVRGAVRWVFLIA